MLLNAVSKAMKKIDHAIVELKEMDAMAAQESAIHSLNATVKFLATIVYIIVVVSFDKYDLSGLIVMILYPVLMFQISGTSIGRCLYKLRIVLPLVCAVGLFNPFLDKSPMLCLGGITITGGVISMITLMMKELQEKNISYHKGTFPLSGNGRALIEDERCFLRYSFLYFDCHNAV